MAQFSTKSVERLDYDFSGFPSDSGKGNCKGQGTIPEPSQARLTAYAEAHRAIFGVGSTEEAIAKLDEATQATDDDQRAKAKEREQKLAEITAELCQNQPSKEQLMDLPPRIKTAFMKWIFGELLDPEVLSADTRR